MIWHKRGSAYCLHGNPERGHFFVLGIKVGHRVREFRQPERKGVGFWGFRGKRWNTIGGNWSWWLAERGSAPARSESQRSGGEDRRGGVEGVFLDRIDRINWISEGSGMGRYSRGAGPERDRRGKQGEWSRRRRGLDRGR